MNTTEPTLKRWTRSEYYTMSDMGWFQRRRVELIDGEIVEMSPQRSFHAAALGLVEDVLRAAYGSRFWVRTQRPLDLGIVMEPEPDVAVVEGNPRDYSGSHPTTALLIVEVSDTTLAYDRGPKASVYAAAGIQDYWILNLIDRHLEVCRVPIPDPAEPHGFGYSSRTIVGATASISPLSAPHVSILVSDLLP